MTDLKGRVALVTGGGRDVGAEICHTLAKAGAKVAVNYNSSKAEAEAVAAEIVRSGGEAIAYKADVADYDQVCAMVNRIKSDFGGLGILVNNAGVVLRKKFSDTKPEEWHKQINACMYGAIHCCHAAGTLLEASGHGRVVSIVGDFSRVGELGLAIVAAARAGTIGLMKSLAREWGRSGVTCNTLALGLIETAHERGWVEANYEKLVKLYQIRRLGQPSDVAPMVSLLSSDAGEWITGQVLSISGGFSMV